MDEHLQRLHRDYLANPSDTVLSARLISALVRCLNGEPAAEPRRAIAFFIHCRTGCSCCNNENHHTGPYQSLAYAKRMVEQYREDRRLASQYASRGVYEIGWSEAEILPDGRIVTDGRIFDGFSDDPDFTGFNEDISDGFYPDSYNTGQAKAYGKSLPAWYRDPENRISTSPDPGY